MEEKPGTRFGNYELVGRIDIGGMGEVYLAHQLSAFGRQVAIKIIRSDLVHDLTARARFLREAEVSAHLKHEHILPLFDFGEVDGRLFLVTPYIEGGTLATRLADKGPLSLVEVHRLFVPLVQAVAYVHRRGVVHRDLKPTNILLDSEDGEIYVRLIDFGIASLQGQSASPPLTMAGHEIGTIAYMAPERLSGIAAPSNDIFSLGVMLHQMLTGRMPGVTSPGVTAPRLPDPLAQVIRRGVVSNPNERYATADELLKAFESAYWQVMNLAQQGAVVSRPGISAESLSQPVPAPSERVALENSGVLPVFRPEPPQPASTRPPERFTHEDYNAPTTSFQPSLITRPPTNRPPLFGPPRLRPPRQTIRAITRRNPLLMTLMALSAVLVIAIGFMLFYVYQTINTTNVSVNFAPQVKAISQVFAFKASLNTKTVNVAQATIPAYTFNDTRTAQQTTATTGMVNCSFFGTGCEQGVDPEDVYSLVGKMQPGLEQSINQTLQAKISTAHGTQIGQISFSNETYTSSPDVDEPGKNVTVTLSEQGSVAYILNTDPTTLVHQMLLNSVAQLGLGYQIITSTISMGQPAAQSINGNLVNMSMAAGADAQYQFTPAQLQAISAGLVGKSLLSAQTFLKDQMGVDPTSVGIHFTSGNSQNMPGDTQHIRLMPLSPATMPVISLTPVSGQTP